MEGQLSSTVPVLQRHRYPKWIVLFGLCIVITLIYSLSSLPDYFSAARILRAAQAAYKAGNFDSSVERYRSALALVPTSRVARLGGAKAIFSNADKSDDIAGLELLVGMRLNSGEWSDLKRVLPAEYQQYFETTGQ